jgi:hypothetical protein
VGLGSLANHERINLSTTSCGLMHDCGCHRVGTHGQTAGSFKVGYAGGIEHVEHYLADKWGGLVVQGGTSKIYVVVGLDATRECHSPVHNGKVFD